MKRVILILIIGFLIGFVFAAGGGGGDSGGGGNSGGGGSSTSGSSGDSGPSFSPVNCDDTGRIQFTMSKQEPITAMNKETNETISVTGYWRFEAFESDPLFTEQGSYSITNSYGLTQTFNCPGLHNCFSIKINKLKCKSRNLDNEINFELIGDNNLDNYVLNFKTKDKVLKYSKELQSKELDEVIVNQNGNMFRIFVDNVSMSDVEIVHNTCLGKNYVYSRVKCSFNGVGAEIESDRLKCGGLLDIQDRVKCRVQLESEQEEYENFFPEECRNHKNPKKCLSIYRNVSECWDIDRSTRRIFCLKEKIRLVSIEDEKDKCDSDDCLDEINERIRTLIKLRFYNLEEQAEILEEKGLLEEKNLVDFVVSIENKKLEFNTVKTKKEMETIIMDVRALWNELMKKVNPG